MVQGKLFKYITFSPPSKSYKFLEILKMISFQDLVDAFDGDIKSIVVCFDEKHIQGICNENKNRMTEDGSCNILFYKSNGEYRVARAFVNNRKLHVVTDSLKDCLELIRVEQDNRIIVPGTFDIFKLKSLA